MISLQPVPSANSAGQDGQKSGFLPESDKKSDDSSGQKLSTLKVCCSEDSDELVRVDDEVTVLPELVLDP